MFNKSFISVMIVTSAFTLVFGQTPETKKEKEKATAFAWSFEGDGAYLGVQTQEINKGNFAKFGLRDVRGVAVEKVMENSPAAAAGIKDGDVIVRFNGEEVTSARKLTRLIGEVDPDHQVKLTISRGGSEQEITATLGKHPTPRFGEGNFAFTMPPMGKMEMPNFKDMPQLKDFPQMKEFREFKDLPQFKEFPKGDFPQGWTPNGENNLFTWRSGEGRQIGVGVSPLTKQLAQHFGVENGMMINEVRENSPAAKAGLKAGDIIVEIDGKAVKADFDLIRGINSKKDGEIAVTYVRDGKRQTVSITPEPSKDGGFFFRTENGEGLNYSPPVPMNLNPSAPTPMSLPKTFTPMPALRFGRII
jgi:serine protease Do